MRLSPTAIEPIRKTRHVSLDPSAAFDLFTSRMETWWPLASHSISESPDAHIRFEGRVGGRVVEITPSGDEHAWAEVIAWDPPHRFAMVWHPTIDPTAASVVEVRFAAVDGGTRLDLEHRGWEEFGEALGAELRSQYDPGWDYVLEHLRS